MCVCRKSKHNTQRASSLLSYILVCYIMCFKRTKALGKQYMIHKEGQPRCTEPRVDQTYRLLGVVCLGS